MLIENNHLTLIICPSGELLKWAQITQMQTFAKVLTGYCNSSTQLGWIIAAGSGLKEIDLRDVHRTG